MFCCDEGSLDSQLLIIRMNRKFTFPSDCDQVIQMYPIERSSADNQSALQALYLCHDFGEHF